MMSGSRRLRQPLRESAALGPGMGSGAAVEEGRSCCFQIIESSSGVSVHDDDLAVVDCAVPVSGGKTASRAATARLLALISGTSSSSASSQFLAPPAPPIRASKTELRLLPSDGANDASSVSSKSTAGDGASSVASLDTCGSASDSLSSPIPSFQTTQLKSFGLAQEGSVVASGTAEPRKPCEEQKQAHQQQQPHRPQQQQQQQQEQSAGDRWRVPLQHPSRSKQEPEVQSLSLSSETSSACRLADGKRRGRNLLALLQGKAPSSISTSVFKSPVRVSVSSPQTQQRVPEEETRSSASLSRRGGSAGGGAFASSIFMRSPDASDVPLPVLLAD